ncbi:MAG: arginine--tRNA ligase [Rubrivivax sp.]|nr:arginine--tRNA ligase [Rubrivivax sp.]
MIQAKQELLRALQGVLTKLARDAGVASPVAAFETPKQAAHGDFAITAAMQLARSLKKNPRELAASLVAALGEDSAFRRWVSALEIAGPGFVNLRLAPAARQAVVREVLIAGGLYGHKPRVTPTDPAAACSAAATGVAGPSRVMVEFVSANPTGPLHVGHGRNAALGDCICNLLETQGHDVHREFYYNDAGVQIHTLAVSTQCRLRGLKPGDAGWPEQAYQGEYIADIAADFKARKTVRADDRQFTASGDPDDFEGIKQFAVAYLRHEQDLDLQAFGVRFDHYYLESSLYDDGRVDATVQRLVASGRTYERDGALWLRTTDYGDDKDRVMRKSVPPGSDPAGTDGAYTYFVPDVAYHLAKFERGFAKVINVQGTDHHGTVARVRAGLQAVGAGIPAGYPDYVLYKMITVMKGGQEVKISKRAGGYVTLRDLIDWTSRDAVRFFLASRKSDTEFTFDIDLALATNLDNPVFYVQYAHARICSVLAQYPGSRQPADLADADLSRLNAPSEVALMLKLAQYPEMLEGAAAEFAPHDVAFYLRELAACFHTYYDSERFLVDDAVLARARIALLAATANVLNSALAVLGVSAPAAMQREAAVASRTPAEAGI